MAGLKTQNKDIEGSDLSGIIGRELAGSRSLDLSEIAARRDLILRYIRGDMPDLPGRKNGSQQTDRTIADVISWILPGIMRTLTAGDQMVQYAPVKEENPEWSEQATAYTNWDFYNNSDGYRVLYNATYDSLATGNGIVRCYFEEEQTKTERWTNVTAEDIAGKLQDLDPENVRILSRAPGEPKTVELEDGVSVEMPTVTVKVEHVLSRGRICDQTCKPENLRMNSTATTLDEARFVGYLHDEYTRSDLVEMGFPRDKVDGLPRYAGVRNELDRELEDLTFRDSPTKSTDPIEVYECYVKADADGDGIAEMLQVWYAGNESNGVVLGWDYWDDELPFTDIPCYPVPHRYDAESVADRTMDIQRVNTVLLRALLDSTYASTTPQRMAKEGAFLNPDALVNPRFGSTLWVSKNVPMAEAYQPLTIDYTGDKALAALQFMGDIVAKRTGISRTTMALDPEALNNQTATASQNMRDAGASQIELIARNMAELGWSKYFAKRLKLAIKHKIIARVPMKPKAAPQQPGMPQQPMSESEFRVVNAAEWDENMAVTINTGLGTGSRDRDMAMLGVMIKSQTEMAQQLAATGLPSAKMKALEFIPKILKSAILLAESAGIKDPSDHYPEVSDADIEAMRKEVQKAAMQPSPQVKIEQEKIKADMMGKQAQMKLDQQKAQTDAQMHGAQQQMDMQLEREKMAGELQLKREQLQAELQLKREQLVAELELKKQLGMYQTAVGAATSQVHPGGEPG